MYDGGSTVIIRARNFLTLASTRPRDLQEWKRRVEYKLRHKPQLRHVKKSEPRHCLLQIGKPELKNSALRAKLPGGNKEDLPD